MQTRASAVSLGALVWYSLQSNCSIHDSECNTVALNWGPAASDFFGHASAHFHNYRDVNFFHWSEASFRRYVRD